MTSSKTLLLVEDNRDDEALLLRALRKNGIVNPVVVAHDGVEALAYLFATDGHGDGGASELPQVVLLDLNLPRLHGLEVLRRIRAEERTRLLPVVVLTSSNEDGDIRGSYESGSNAYLRKSIDFAEFTETVLLLSRFWLALNLPVRAPGGRCAIAAGISPPAAPSGRR